MTYPRLLVECQQPKILLNKTWIFLNSIHEKRAECKISRLGPVMFLELKKAPYLNVRTRSVAYKVCCGSETSTHCIFLPYRPFSAARDGLLRQTQNDSPFLLVYSASWSFVGFICTGSELPHNYAGKQQQCSSNGAGEVLPRNPRDAQTSPPFE